MVEEQYDKKPKGWYGQRVKEMDEEFRQLEQLVESLKAEVAEQRRILDLADHPMLSNYESFYNRFRQMEMQMDTVMSTVQHFQAEIDSVRRLTQSLSAPRTRGA